MSIMAYMNGDELALAKNVANPNYAYGILYDMDDATKPTNGNTKSATFSAPDMTDNYHYAAFKTNLLFKKGDAITISAIGYLTGKQVKDGYYKATVFKTDLQSCYDDSQDSVFLKSGQLSSKTFIANQDSDPANPPVLMFYPGIAGNCGGNSLALTNVKVEKNSIATPWIPSSNDMVMQSELDNLKAQIEQLKSK